MTASDYSLLLICFVNVFKRYESKLVDVLKCKNTAAWCEAAQPNCNTEIAREKCKKYCGICESKS